MIQLTQEDKEFISGTLKPFLKTNDWEAVRKRMNSLQDNRRKNLFAFFVENDFPILTGLTTIPKDIFTNSEVSRIKIPKTIKVIGAQAFSGCAQLTSVTIENGVTTIDRQAFEGTALTSVQLPESIEYIGAQAFKNTNLQQINLPDRVTDLLNETFANCSDKLVIYAHSRKDLPPQWKLKVPADEVTFYKQHLKLKVGDKDD